MDARYDSIEFEYIKKIYENYWDKLRAVDYSQLTENAINEVLEEVTTNSLSFSR